jgi:formamidopyrimidine-DNA glycosylase
MPELPDLVYIKSYLDSSVMGRMFTEIRVKQPIVVRTMTAEPIGKALAGAKIRQAEIHGPFLRLDTTGPNALVINLMLAGRLQHQHPSEKPEGFLCVRCTLDDGSALNVCDEKKMTKVYCTRQDEVDSIPKYAAQGIDILSSSFTEERFRSIAKAHTRKQVRVFINDHTSLSAIGNAYADEILFAAKIHPKTFVAKLTSEEVSRLYASIKEVIEWGIQNVFEAHEPIHEKIRSHMRVRNRKGEPCPRCGTTIRREGVRGHDVYFCPSCQPPSRHLFLDWNRTSGSRAV